MSHRVDHDFLLRRIDEEIFQIDGQIAAEKLAGNVVKEAAEQGERTGCIKLRAWIERLKKIEDAPIGQIETAIRDYHFALDSREHGGVAQDKAIKAIESALNLQWQQGEELARRKAL